MINALTWQQTCDMFQFVGEKVIENKSLLTQVDSAIGDGDHGIGMSLGFSTAIQNIKERNPDSINEVFRVIGMSMINSMGGASGVIFGTMFLGGIENLPIVDNLNLRTLSGIVANSVNAVKRRGKASMGDKTMVDALEPASKALSRCAAQSDSLYEGLKGAEDSARHGMENTKDYVARFGRAKSLGQRAIGFQDAGATTVWIIFRSMREWLEQVNTTDTSTNQPG